MSTGISISSINRIKELAEKKKFKEALEILDTQNLDKSINPQFLRISGEIFRMNKRYYDSRRILLKAHQMAPQGNRIIYELICLYLELGYFTKAQRYYEQYKFYTTPDDTLKDYVEYIVKKALGEDVRELASILIPILERMPEDRWNFEAVLLYHKLDRKDKALDESRYILQNFKESEYVKPVIDYIDDKLDVDSFFYVYPREEQPEDEEQFKELIELEEKILEADQLRMYPPEARIMVEAEDKDAAEITSNKEKKAKKSKKKSSKKMTAAQEKDDNQEKVATALSDVSDGESIESRSTFDEKNADEVLNDVQSVTTGKDTEQQLDVDSDGSLEEQRIKEEREAALNALLSKKIDKEKIKESAKQVAKAMKEIDTDKAKQQVKLVAEAVRDNVKKATDVLGEAVGTKQSSEEYDKIFNAGDSSEEWIVDGIIESVLEAPKKPIGQVVTNEELDALIPDSLEAMSEEEVAQIEAKKEEAERIEQEVIEAAQKYEEEKKSRRAARGRKTAKVEAEDNILDNAETTADEETRKTELQKISIDNANMQDDALSKDASSDDKQESIVNRGDQVRVKALEESGLGVNLSDESYNELRNRYISDLQEEENPLESLGFISVVHSDVDETLEKEIPDAADMLRQMIDDKEFYSGENSLGFESKASYHNHGFEIEDYDFESYKEDDIVEQESPRDILVEEEEPMPVQVIFAHKPVLVFEDMVSEESISQETEGEDAQSDKNEVIDKALRETTVSQMHQTHETNILKPSDMNIVSPPVENKDLQVSTNKSVEDMILEEVEKRVELLGGNIDVEEMLGYKKKKEDRRNQLRIDVVLSFDLKNKLLELKESR